MFKAELGIKYNTTEHTLKDMNVYAEYLKIGDHPVKRYRERFNCKKTTDIAIRNTLNMAYFNGKLMTLDPKEKLRNLLKYGGEEAYYYKYANVVVVIIGSSEKMSTDIKNLVTCYPYDQSKFAT